MTFSEIAEIESRNTEYVYLYKEGIFWKAYERSAYILCTQVRNYTVIQRYCKKIKGGLKLLHIGFPISKEQEHISSLKLIEKSETSMKLEAPSAIDPADFEKWKENIWKEEEEVTGEAVPKEQTTENISILSGGRIIFAMQGITNELRKFDLATATPVECMVFLSGLKKKLLDVERI